ncbi:hypothetical protein CC78DRAFT_620801 [Lojkania enalia]|uniref:DNA replication checkpoint mediator MRC1 domain-containing protein n=1 Tax=Lojkania enalia TaxID=147567 RepID=A0A9P4K5A8_9PLEO|nr:hypothetical protein CC78DRAFT_620801 [Didymosphaeria enalia]
MAAAMDIKTQFEEDVDDLSQPLASTQILPASNALSNLARSDTESDSEELPVQIPRGKLIARLQPNAIKDSSESGEDENQDDEDVYERIKKRLMTSKAQNEPSSEAKEIPKLPDVGSSDDEMNMPVWAHNIRKATLGKKESSFLRSSPLSSPQSRRSSPGLFVSPTTSPVAPKASNTTLAMEDDSDASIEHITNKDLEERVKRIRAERKAKQMAQQGRRKPKPQQLRSMDPESDSDPDGETGRRLTQSTRPTRKAGKKALAEMSREQQRISRNMQLTHQAKTKRRYGTKDLLSTFGFNRVDSELVQAVGLATADSGSALVSSDAEGGHPYDTPPTSPASQADMAGNDISMDMDTPAPTDLAKENSGALVSHLPQPASEYRAASMKGKGRAPESQHVPINPLVALARPVTTQASLVKPASDGLVELSDSDDDTKTTSNSRFAVFDRLPQKKQQEAPSLLHLRHLAHLTSPGKAAPRGKVSMNVADLQFSLAQKARQQAQRAREERIEELKRRGIHIETEEEREKHQVEIEDMVAQLEKARQEDLKLQKLERGEAKKKGEASDGLLSSDESEDEDYIGSGAEDADEVEVQAETEIELSGSEEDVNDESDDEEGLDEEGIVKASNSLLDEEANEEDDVEDTTREEQANDEEEREDDVANAPSRLRVGKRARNVVVDDEDESEAESPKKLAAPQELTQATVQDEEMAVFGFNSAGTTLGLTQMFASTMANIEPNSQFAHHLDHEPEQDSLDFLRILPATQPGNILGTADDLLVPNSQARPSHQQQHDSQAGPASEVHFGISQLIETSPAFSQTQLSEIPEPTQDVGLELSRSPAGIALPSSTIDTVLIPAVESPVMKRKGRLHRRKDLIAELSDADEEMVVRHDSEENDDLERAGNAFAVMKKAAKRRAVIDNFNKKTSWARDAVEEQAEESEDEYAGIGGASDDDSGEEDEELQKMIDSDDIKVDERKLAAYYADKAKADDEKNINQLYKDIMNGGLRKRRGGDTFDMSDSEDEAEQRRRKKQMEFRKMTKALIADERIGKIAENPKQSAFFKTLADHDDDPDYGFLNAPDLDMDVETSQSQSQSNDAIQSNEDISIPDSQTTGPITNPLKRKYPDSQDKENRPPPHLRRTAPNDNFVRKPMTFADVQHSITELVEDPQNMVIPDSQYSDSESDLEITDIPSKPDRKPIIDRLALSRTTVTTSATSTHLAFHATSSSAHQPGFKVPSLVRRATSNLSAASSTTTSGASTPAEAVIRRGGTGRSNIHAQAREAERKAALEKSDKRRKESLKKMVGKARSKWSVLKGLDGGFE